MTANNYLSPTITIPSALTITAISQSNPMQISTSMNSDQYNSYQINQVVILSVPVTFGMWQANGLRAIISAVDEEVLSVCVDSTQFDAFLDPENGQIATLAPSGSRNLQYNNDTNVAFKSLNNRGN